MFSLTVLEPSPNHFPLFNHDAGTARANRRATLMWTSPRIVEIPVGQEINSYACADRN
jgi:coenzyme PQQ precursor peptide PqqA